MTTPETLYRLKSMTENEAVFKEIEKNPGSLKGRDVKPLSQEIAKSVELRDKVGIIGGALLVLSLMLAAFFPPLYPVAGAMAVTGAVLLILRIFIPTKRSEAMDSINDQSNEVFNNPKVV